MIKAFSDAAWEDYTYWETQDRKTLKRILKLIEDSARCLNRGSRGVPLQAVFLCRLWHKAHCLLFFFHQLRGMQGERLPQKTFC